MTDEPVVPDELTSPEVLDTSKKFTQADVDRLIQREKAKFKPLKDELDTLKTGKSDVLAAYEAVITGLVTDMAKDIPPSILKLLTKLTPLEQLEYLSDPENNVVFEKKEFPLPKTKAKGNVHEFKPAPIDKFL